MFIDDVAQVLSASVTATRAMALDEGLFLPGDTDAAVKGTVLRHVKGASAALAHDFALGFLGLLPKAAVLECHGLPTREAGGGSLMLHALSDFEMGRARDFWSQPRGAVWFEARFDTMRRGWLAVQGPDRLRIFEAHHVDGGDAVSLLPYATDTIWQGDGEGRAMRGAHDPLGVVDAYAEAEAMALTGLSIATPEVHAALTREADLVLMASIGLAFASTRIEEIKEVGPVGTWRRRVTLGRDPEVEGERALAGLPGWDGGAVGDLH